MAFICALMQFFFIFYNVAQTMLDMFYTASTYAEAKSTWI